MFHLNDVTENLPLELEIEDFCILVHSNLVWYVYLGCSWSTLNSKCSLGNYIYLILKEVQL